MMIYSKKHTLYSLQNIKYWTKNTRAKVTVANCVFTCLSVCLTHISTVWMLLLDANSAFTQEVCPWARHGVTQCKVTLAALSNSVINLQLQPNSLAVIALMLVITLICPHSKICYVMLKVKHTVSKYKQRSTNLTSVLFVQICKRSSVTL